MAVQAPSDGRPTNGANPWIDSLVGGGRWTDDTEDGVVTINVYFQSGPDPYNVLPVTNEWSDEHLSAFRHGFSAWEAVANVDFVEVDDKDKADIWYWLVSDTEIPMFAGWHDLPNLEVEEPLYGTINKEYVQGFRKGEYGIATVMHELGHGLGLEHPHDGAIEGGYPDSTTFPGVEMGDWASLGEYQLNQGIWTLMSYNTSWAVRYPSPKGLAKFGEVVTPMAFDIAAMQAIYGANNDYRSGDDVYRLPTSNEAGTFWSCIWDTGGEDTISAAGATGNVTINLNEAPLIGPNAGGFISAQDEIRGGFTIANSVVIENAVGGAGKDKITGNESANLLKGGKGNDVLNALGEADRLYGGHGDDMLMGGMGNDISVGGRGRDIIIDNDGDNRLFGGDGNDRLFAQYGRDTLYGGTGDDRLNAAAGDDRLFGEGGLDRLLGGSGDDRLTGGAGKDYLSGETGADVFDFDAVEESGPGFRRDVIVDFESGVDLVDLRTIDAVEGQEGNQKFSWVARTDLDAAFTGEAGQLRYANGALLADLDGDRKADFKILVQGDAVLAGDVLL